MGIPEKYRIIITVGGSGGHLYPGLAVAQTLEEKLPGCEILFVGASGKIEMEKVPAQGFKIKGLWLRGLRRGSVVGNLLLPLRIMVSYAQASYLLSSFKPNVIFCVGGYVSVPLAFIASRRRIPVIVHEANAVAGLATRLMAPFAEKVTAGFPECRELQEKFRKKVVYTGNPVREQIARAREIAPAEARTHLGLDPARDTLLVLGGSLGARSLNEFVAENWQQIVERGIQILWQTGTQSTPFTPTHPLLHPTPFIDRMDLAYASATLVVCRAGAITLSELAVAGKPAIVVPSPNVSNDHQTANASCFARQEALIVIADKDIKTQLCDTILKLINNKEQLTALQKKISSLAQPLATNIIANLIINELAKSKNAPYEHAPA